MIFLHKALSREQKLDGMTRMKFRDRENRKILTGFRDMANFITGNRDLIPPLVGPHTRVYTSIWFVHRFCAIDSVLRASKHSERASHEQLGSMWRCKLPGGAILHILTSICLQIVFPSSSGVSFQWTHLITK